jgi:hypothetical protein
MKTITELVPPPSEIEIAETMSLLKDAGLPQAAQVVRGLAAQRDALLLSSRPKLRQIEWSDGRYSCYSGMVGNRRICTINYTTHRADEKPWKLHVTAFGFEVRAQYKSLELAKDAAPIAIGKLIEFLFEV